MPRPNRYREIPKYEKRRCAYCNKLFDLTKPNKKFCKLQHQQAFNHQGMALGPLKERLPKWITREVRKQLAGLERKVIAEAVAIAQGYLDTESMLADPLLPKRLRERFSPLDRTAA